MKSTSTMDRQPVNSTERLASDLSNPVAPNATAEEIRQKHAARIAQRHENRKFAVRRAVVVAGLGIVALVALDQLAALDNGSQPRMAEIVGSNGEASKPQPAATDVVIGPGNPLFSTPSYTASNNNYLRTVPEGQQITAAAGIYHVEEVAADPKDQSQRLWIGVDLGKDKGGIVFADVTDSSSDSSITVNGNAAILQPDDGTIRVQNNQFYLETSKGQELVQPAVQTAVSK